MILMKKILFEISLDRLNDLLKGGIGDKIDPSEFDQQSLMKGIHVEMEHTNDILIAMEIAIDHLSEDPNYYKKLMKMEL